MPNGNPPRRSKQPDEPKTIDLEAERVDDPAAETAVTATEDAAAAQSEPVSEAAAEANAASSAEASSPAPKQAPKSGSGGGAGAIAAGILGGLIALVGAGAAQYAGYIPNFGPSQKIELPDYAGQIASLEAKLDEVAKKANTPPAIDLSAVDNRIKAIETAMSKLPVGDLTDVLAIQGKLNEVAAQSAKDQEELASVANRLKETEAKVNQPRDDVDVARAIASAGLKAAIDRGGPFQAELQTLASVAKDDPSVAALQAFAAKGVPSRAELVKLYPDAADNMLAVLNKPIPGQSLSERLFKSAFSVIKVRPVGNVTGDNPQAVIARIGDKLQNGDLSGASAEWAKLPDDMKAAGADFKTALDARVKVEDLVGQALKGAVTGTGKQG